MGTEFVRPRSETRGERGRKALVRHTRNSKYTAHRWYRHSCIKPSESFSRLILFPTLSADRLSIALIAIGAVTVLYALGEMITFIAILARLRLPGGRKSRYHGHTDWLNRPRLLWKARVRDGAGREWP